MTIGVAASGTYISSNPGVFAFHLVTLRHDNNESKHSSSVSSSPHGRMGGGGGSRENIRFDESP